MSVGLLIAIIVGVIVLIVKRFLGEPVDARDTFVTPLILVGIGIYSVAHVEGLSATDITWLVIGAIVGIAFGAIRGTTTVLFTRDGHLWQRYTPKTLVVWAISTASGFGISLLGTTMGMHADAKPVTLSIGIGMLGEMLTLGLRALSTGVPFAPAKKSTQGPNDQRADSNSYLDRFLDNLGHPGIARPDTEHSTRDTYSPQPTHSEAPHNRPEMISDSPRTNREQPAIDRSPTLHDGLEWLQQFRNRRP